MNSIRNNCLAIIPARGGSKRIPKKNIRLFLGKPIIQYSIEAAMKSGLFSEVMVSTDDEEIAAISMKIGAEIPFYRSEKTANDFAIIADVVDEVLVNYKQLGKEFDYCCCVLATAPLITKETLLKGYKQLIELKLDTVIPVAPFSYPIQRALNLENGLLNMIWPENYSKRSQDLPKSYHDSGQFYWLNIKSFLIDKKITFQNAGSVILSELEVQDIDTEIDWKIAEIKWQLLCELREKNAF